MACGLVPAPLRVVFPSCTFEVVIRQLDPEHQRPHWTLCTNGWEISEVFHQQAWLEEALYHTGFATRHATVPETIMLKLVREKQAERLPPPEKPPALGRGQP
jgi:hypothetical protein